MKRKSLIALILALVMLPYMATGCGSNKAVSSKLRSTAGSQETNSLCYPLSGSVSTIDPQLYVQVQESQIAYQIYEPLFNLDNKGNMMMVLAEKVTPDETGSSVAVTLKSGILFHEGQTLTAKDVAYTLSRCEFSTPCCDLYANSSIDVIDDTHLVWNFPAAEEGAGFNELISSVSNMFIVNKEFCEGILSDPNDNLKMTSNGTGAYYVDNVASSGDITLKRNEKYHGDATIDTVYCKVITGSQPLAYESGDIDLALYDAVAFEEIKKYDNVETEVVLVNNVMFLMNNCSENSVLKDKRIREAATRAINRNDAAMAITDGNGYTAYNMATPLVDYYDDVCNHYDMDLDASKKLLTEAGYSQSTPCPIDLITISDPLWVSCTEVLKANLEKSYFKVTIEELADPTRFYIGGFDMALMAIGLNNSFTSYSVLFDDNSGLNMACISGSERDEVLAKINKSVDKASAQEAMIAVVDTLAYVPLTYVASCFAYDAKLNHGEFNTNLGSFMFREFSWKN